MKRTGTTTKERKYIRALLRQFELDLLQIMDEAVFEMCQLDSEGEESGSSEESKECTEQPGKKEGPKG